MTSTHNRIIAAALSATFIGQVLLFGDGTAKGILHPDNIAYAAEAAEKRANEKELAEEFERAIQGIGEVDYFEGSANSSTSSSRRTRSLSSTAPLRTTSSSPLDSFPSVAQNLTVSGVVSSLEDCDVSNAKVIIFNADWQDIATTNVNADGSFSVTATGFTSTATHVKIECNGYLPRFYRNMGYGSYDLGENILIPGDTTYNPDHNNEWSDETIDEHDLAFAYDAVGARRATGDYVADYDLNNDGIIDGTDMQILDDNYYDSYDGDDNYLPELDIDQDGHIYVYDYNYILQNHCGSCLQSENYYDYLDFNDDGVIDASEYDWYADWIDEFIGWNSGDYETYLGAVLTLTGNCYNDSMSMYNTLLDLDGYSLYINETFNFMTSNPDIWDEGEGSTIFMNGGKIHTGYFNFGQANCYDAIIMQNPNDLLYIENNWIYTTMIDCDGLWTAGDIYFKGSSWNVNEPSGEKAVYSSGTHVIHFGYDGGLQTVLWHNPLDYIYDENGNPNTLRTFNFDYVDEDGNCLGLVFDGGYSPERYWIRPWFKDAAEPDYTLYRKGWEMGDGVHIATGNYTKTFTYLSVESPGVQSDFIRTYNSMNNEEGSFGVGWDFNVDVSKIITPAIGYYQVVLPDGSNTTFKDAENGGFECLNAHSTMVKSGDEYTITNAAQSQYHFNSSGELDWVKDPEGNILTISSIVNNVRTVTDSTGREYTITYTDNTEHKRITEIKDVTADRTAIFSYSDGKLISATSVSGGTETYEYDANGRLCKITNCYDEVTDQVVYNENGSVNWLVNADGLKQVYTYDSAQKQTGVEEYDGDTLVKTFHYDYDEKYAVKTNTVDTDGTTYTVDRIEYRLDNGENKYDEVSKSYDIAGNATEYQYDTNGNVISTKNPDGTYTYANYNNKNSVIAEVDEMGYAKIYAYADNGTRLVKQGTSLYPLAQADIDAVRAADFNPAIYLAANKSSYAITSHEYYADSYVSGVIGLIHRTTDPEGYVTEYDYYTDGVGKGLVRSKILKDGNTIVNTVDYEYNAQLHVSKESTSYDLSNNVYSVKEFSYDKFNNVVEERNFGTGDVSATTITDYDLLSRKTAEYAPNYSADRSHGTIYTYYPNGSVKTQTDAEGNTTSYTYNAYGLAAKKTNPDGTINITEYDGLQREKATYFQASVGSTRQVLTETSYEYVGNNYEIYNALNSYTNYWYKGLKSTKKTYITADKQVFAETLNDFRDNVVYEKTNGETKRTSRYYANGQLARQTDALGNITKYEYGKLNKLEKTYVPFSTNNNGSDNCSITENSYDKNGNLTAVKQTIQEENDSTPKYSLTKNQYNAQGLLVKVALSDGTTNSDINITKYFYNNAGIQTMMYTGLNSESDTDFMTTSYTYDAWGRLVNTHDSTGYDSGTTTYDLNGNVISSTDANGNVTTNTYDALNRLLTANTVATDSSKNVSKSNTYDSMGRVTSTTSNGLTTSYQYDALGRKYTENEVGNNYSSFRGFFYVGVSQYPEREIVGINHLLMYSYKSYEYDAEMRISNVKESGDQTVSYTYDANGNKASETLANGVVSNYTYNKSNKIRRIENYSNNTLVSAYDYTYYLDGSDASKTRTENGVIETTSYEYDALKRLVEESVAVGNNTTDTYSYEYDDYDNRSQMTVSGTENYVTEYSYSDAQGNYTALLQREVKTSENANDLLNPTLTETTTYTYDSNGNQIRKIAPQKTENYTYDGLNQLIAYSDGDNTSSYKYDTNGLRYEKTVNGQRINHVWDAAQQIIADIYHGDYYEADCYIRGTNLAAKYRYQNAVKSDYTYYIQNAHGDVVNLADSTGAITKTYKYDAFGVEKNIEDSDTNVFRYCGEYYDAEIGTVYLRARYYDPTIGRFISRDSFTGKNDDPLSLNLYTYCANNPIVNIDPDGHFWHIVGAAIVGAVVNSAITVTTNLITGQKWSDGLLQSAAIGAASGALAATGLGTAVKVVGDVAISVVDDMATQFKNNEPGEYDIWSTVGAASTSLLSFGLGELASNKFTKSAREAAKKSLNKGNRLVNKANSIKSAGGRYWKGAMKKGKSLIEGAAKSLKRLDAIDNVVSNGISYLSGVSYNCLTNAKQIYNHVKLSRQRTCYYSKGFKK